MNYAVLVDLNSMRLSYDSFSKAIAQIDGKIAYAKLYGYNNKRNNDFNNFIKTYGVEVALPVSNRKKVRVDIRQVIDAVIIACTHKNVDAFFIICSELDSIAMINALKKLGKKVVLGIQSPTFLAEQCDGSVILERTVADGDKAEEKTEPIEVSDREFLPYTGIESKKVDEMDSVKRELQQLIDEKKRRKSEIEIGQNVLQLDDLLKQYF